MTTLRHRHRSNMERIIGYRRNAILGIVPGVMGIAVGACFVIFHFGIFSDHANEVVLGIFVFLCGYSSVLAGCWCWLKAKAWNEAIVFIGLMPFAIFFIPFVRVIVRAAPGMLPLSMVMMPLILVVVVLVLPNKSGVSNAKPPWERNQAGWERLGVGRRSSDTDQPNNGASPNGGQAKRLGDSGAG